jgi:hypothetical protein
MQALKPAPLLETPEQLEVATTTPPIQAVDPTYTPISSPLTDPEYANTLDFESPLTPLQTQLSDLQVMERALSMVSTSHTKNTPTHNTIPTNDATYPYGVSNTKLKVILHTPNSYKVAYYNDETWCQQRWRAAMKCGIQSTKLIYHKTAI